VLSLTKAQQDCLYALSEEKMTPFAVEPVIFCFSHLNICLLFNIVVFVTILYRLYKEAMDAVAVSGSVELATIVFPT
jgi:hypothetical protein